MKSRILYDSRNNEIKWSTPKPIGTSHLPSFESLCHSARIPESEIEYMETCIINDKYITSEAKRKLRIEDGEAHIKPKVNISTDKKEVDISEDPIFTVEVDITDTLEEENFSEVELHLEDVEFTVSLEENSGSKDIELTETEIYTITCKDEYFRSNSVEVEGV